MSSKFAVKASVPQRFRLLKRPEEKKVVEKMHENAKFVEDVTRQCVKLLKEKYPKRYCTVKCVSFESIHDHNVCSEWSGTPLAEA